MTYADVLGSWKDTGLQERVCREALFIYEQTGGPRRRHYRHCLESLASALEAQGKMEEAGPFVKRLAAKNITTQSR
jgi:hypothetical protein